jgi:hypothetical protein
MPATAVRLLVGAHGAATLSSTCATSFCGGGFLNLLHHRRAADDGVGACSSALKNKGGGPRVPTYAKTKICLLSAPINLTGGVVFRKAPPANSTRRFMPRDCWIGWDSVVRTHVFV